MTFPTARTRPAAAGAIRRLAPTGRPFGSQRSCLWRHCVTRALPHRLVRLRDDPLVAMRATCQRDDSAPATLNRRVSSRSGHRLPDLVLLKTRLDQMERAKDLSVKTLAEEWEAEMHAQKATATVPAHSRHTRRAAVFNRLRGEPPGGPSVWWLRRASLYLEGSAKRSS
jgi:hypothetical protein